MQNKWLYIEGAILLFVTPFLIYSTIYSLATISVLLLLVFSWLVGWYFTKQPFPVTPLNVILLLFLIMILVGIFVSADPNLTQPKIMGIVLGITLWRYTALAITSYSQLVIGLAIFVVVGLVMAVLGMMSADWHAELPFIQQLLPLLPHQLVSLPESPSAGVHTNNLAGALQPLTPLLFALFIGWHPLRFKIASSFLFGSLFLLTTFLLFLTQSRSGWAGNITGILFFVSTWNLLTGSAARKTAVWLILGTGVILAFLAISLIGIESIQTFLQDPPQNTPIGTLTTLSFRQEVWHWAIIAIQDFPFTGTGLGTFRQVVRRLYPLDVPATYDIAHAHNIFLQTALDIGLPGLIAYLAMLGIAGFMGWQVAKWDDQLRPFALGLLASLIAFHTYGLTDALALGSKPGILFWMALGLLTAMFNCSSGQVRQCSN